MITNIFGDSLSEHELIDALIEGSETDAEGEYIAYSDSRGTLSTLHIKPSQPNIIYQDDETFGSSIFPIEEVEEAVEVFLGYVEMHEKADLPVSRLA